MLISIGDAGKHLDDLVSTVEVGGEVVLTRQGRAVVRLVSLDHPPLDRAARRSVLEAARRRARAGVEISGRAAAVSAARAQDVLYADDGTPG